MKIDKTCNKCYDNTSKTDNKCLISREPGHFRTFIQKIHDSSSYNENKVIVTDEIKKK